MLWNVDDAQGDYASDVIGNLDSQADRHGIEVYITHLAAGEAVMRYCECIQNGDIERQNEPPNDRFMYQFNRILERTDAEFIAISENARRIASRVQSIDERIENNDALILGAAMSDLYCSKLVTTDRNLIETRAVPQLKDQVREGAHYSFNVTENY